MRSGISPTDSGISPLRLLFATSITTPKNDKWIYREIEIWIHHAIKREKRTLYLLTLHCWIAPNYSWDYTRESIVVHRETYCHDDRSVSISLMVEKKPKDKNNYYMKQPTRKKLTPEISVLIKDRKVTIQLVETNVNCTYNCGRRRKHEVCL